MRKLIPYTKRTKKAPCGCDINALEKLTQTQPLNLIDNRRLETIFYECGFCGERSKIQLTTRNKLKSQKKGQLTAYNELTRKELLEYAPTYKGTIEPEDEEAIRMRG